MTIRILKTLGVLVLSFAIFVALLYGLNSTMDIQTHSDDMLVTSFFMVVGAFIALAIVLAVIGTVGTIGEIWR